MTATDRSAHRALRWAIGGAVLLAGAFAVPVIDTGELDEPWWSVMTIFAVLSTIFISIGLSTLVHIDVQRSGETDR